jgi:hypothetical protein
VALSSPPSWHPPSFPSPPLLGNISKLSPMSLQTSTHLSCLNDPDDLVCTSNMTTACQKEYQIRGDLARPPRSSPQSTTTIFTRTTTALMIHTLPHIMNLICRSSTLPPTEYGGPPHTSATGLSSIDNVTALVYDNAP